MSIIESILSEFEREAATTRRLLERTPQEHFSWKPHEKSMHLGRLASHIAEIPLWTKWIVNHDEFVLGQNSYQPFDAASPRELLQKFDAAVEETRGNLRGQSDEDLRKLWKLKIQDEVKMEAPRIVVLRSMMLNHLIHHRGQLSVFLRLKDVPIPSIYGPSADEGV